MPPRSHRSRLHRSGPRRRAGLVITVVALGTLLLGLAAVPAVENLWFSPENNCTVPQTHDPQVIAAVYEVGTSRGVPQKVMLAAFAAGWVESRMHNLPCGDRDSLGVFQQRPSQDWGTPEQVTDVEYAAAAFFARAERANASRPELTPGELAQRVQRSAFPERYEQAAPKARLLLAEAERLSTP